MAPTTTLEVEEPLEVNEEIVYIKAIAPIILFIYIVISFSTNHRNIFAGACCSNHKGTFFATNRSENLHPSVKKPSHFWAWDIIDKSTLTSGFRAGHKTLLLVRCASLLLTLFTFVVQGIRKEFNQDGSSASQFTNWTFFLFGLSAVAGMVIIMKRYLPPGRGYIQELNSAESQEWGIWDKLFLLSFVTSLSAGLFASLFYWAVLHSGSVSYYDVVKHGGVYIFGIVDLLISRVPVVSYHHMALTLYGATYLIFMWIYNSVNNTAVYNVLDLNNSASLKYYCVLPFLVSGSFFLVYLMAGLRELAGRGKFDCCGWCPCECC